MAKTNMGSTIGSWSFLIGVVLAIILAFYGSITQTLMWLLVIIGIIVGLLNIADEEVEPFLLSGVVLIIASSFGNSVVSISPLFNRVLNSMLLIFVPATIIVAIKNVFSLARN